jgi:hypothetical protein
MQEIWKNIDIDGFENLYAISNIGNIKSFERTNKKEKILKLPINRKGYYKVSLYNNNKVYQTSLHRLLAKHFIPNPNNYPTVRHLNDIKKDNRIENLAWGTNKHNSEDMVRNGKSSKGERNGNFGKFGELSATHKLILNTQTGVYYFGIKEAAESIASKYGTLASKLAGNDRNNTSLIYV